MTGDEPHPLPVVAQLSGTMMVFWAVESYVARGGAPLPITVVPVSAAGTSITSMPHGLVGPSSQKNEPLGSAVPYWSAFCEGIGLFPEPAGSSSVPMETTREFPVDVPYCHSTGLGVLGQGVRCTVRQPGRRGDARSAVGMGH